MKNFVEKSSLNNIGFILSDATRNSQNCARNRMNIHLKKRGACDSISVCRRCVGK